jgi:hypothetical protein
MRLLLLVNSGHTSLNLVAMESERRETVCVPNRATKSLERKRKQKKQVVPQGQEWRT